MLSLRPLIASIWLDAAANARSCHCESNVHCLNNWAKFKSLRGLEKICIGIVECIKDDQVACRR